MQSPGFHHPAKPSRRRGVALLLVISTVAIMCLLVIAFLSLVRSEEQSSEAFAQGVEVRNLADIPLNLVIGQLRKATENNGARRTWASQPGMIRVFGTTNDGGQHAFRALAESAYKLYSSDQMVWTPQSGADLASMLAAEQVAISDWDQRPGMFVDLNQPVPVLLDGETAELEFPIFDPRATFSGADEAIEGLAVDPAAVAGTRLPASSSDPSARAPMPVRWLYVLRDGTTVTPSSADDERAIFTGPDAPTRDNPIVGRVAFWTDDETCKVNINTASEGTGWEVPRANNDTDHLYANRIPAQNEFSRYPGHPATTSLSPVFQRFGPQFVINSSLSDDERRQRVERFHRLAPRLDWGGTMGGTRNAPAAIPIMLRDERLYSSVDEMFFDANRVNNDAGLTREHLNMSRFVLTAHSRAPELNLFNKPRVMLWPVSRNTNDRNEQDRLLAFLGTGGGRPWLFDRHSNYKNHNEVGSSQHPWQDLRASDGSRNWAMYDAYMRFLTGNQVAGHRYQIPGFGGTFVEKYGAARRDQILTQKFDLMRWGINQYSTGLTPQYAYLPARGGIAGTSNSGLLGETSAVPLQPGTSNSRGFGRWPTITEMTIVFVATRQDTPPVGGQPAHHPTHLQAYLILEPFSPTAGPPSWTGNVRYRIEHLQNFQVHFNRPNGASSPQQSLGFPPVANATNRANYAEGYGTGGHSTPYTGMFSMFRQPDRGFHDGPDNARGTPKTIDGYNENLNYPFFSQEIAVPADATSMALGGAPNPAMPGIVGSGVDPGLVRIEILTGWNSGDHPLRTQEIYFRLPTTEMPIPRLHGDQAYWSINYRIARPGGQMRDHLIRDGDVTRSIHARGDAASPTKGDLRFHAASPRVPPEFFHVHPEYHNRNRERVHFLRHGAWTWDGQFGPADPTGPIGQAHGSNNRPSTRNTAGTLIPGVVYMRDCWPSAPQGLNGALNRHGRLGDWDTGPGRIEDGPYINMPDQGNDSTGRNAQTGEGNGGYFSRGSYTIEDGTTFAPNRQVASAVVFGSLPTGIDPAQFSGNVSQRQNAVYEPWQTLLFTPVPASRTTPALQEPTGADHKGFEHPRDHLLLDLWWMPIIEPYAISEPFSTAGKINMNYQMVPFGHIERSTGIHAVMKSTRLMAITPNSLGGTTEAGLNNAGGGNYKEGTRHRHELRYDIDVPKTLDGFRHRFNQGDVFRSASEICEILLIPKRIPGASYNTDAQTTENLTYANAVQWWNGSPNAPDAFEGTGDNLRESPYNAIYPRLTTKSNTYTVHYRVQRLRKARGTNPAEWVEDGDRVAAEYRGSATIERYLDPNDSELVAVMIGSSAFEQSWDDYYRMRIINRKQFAP